MSLLIAALTVSALLQTSMGFNTTSVMDDDVSTLSCGDAVSGDSWQNIYNFTNDAVQDVLFSTCGSSASLDNFEIHYGTGSVYDYSPLGNVTEMTSDYCDDEAYELYVEDLAAGTYLVVLTVNTHIETTTMVPGDSFDFYAVCGDDDIGDFYGTASTTEEGEDSADLSPLSCGDEASGNSSLNIYNFTNDAVQDVLFSTCGSSASLDNFEIHYGTGSIYDYSPLGNVTEMTDEYCDDGDAYELYVEDLAAGSYLVVLTVNTHIETTTMVPGDSFDFYAVCGDELADSAVRVSMAMVMSLVSVVMAMFV